MAIGTAATATAKLAPATRPSARSRGLTSSRMTDPAWSFAEARQILHDASAAQRSTEQEMKLAYRAYAVAEENYRLALAKEIVATHNDGVAWSTAPDLARGDKEVAELRRKRDIAEGVKEAMVQAAWRRAADRRDAGRFCDWSMRRDLAEFHGEEPE
jgi:hypothetical protein